MKNLRCRRTLRNSLSLCLKAENLLSLWNPAGLYVGNAGILVTKTLYLKEGTDKEFVVVDAGMNDLIRPSLYDAYHHIDSCYQEEKEQQSSVMWSVPYANQATFSRKREN